MVTFWSIELRVLIEVSRDLRTLYRWGEHLGFSLGSPQGIHTWLHLVQWKTSLHSNHCREIRPSFETGHLGFHSTWGSKLRVPLTYLWLREGYSWGASANLDYLFNRILGIRSLLKMIWRPWSFPRVPMLKLVFLSIWDGCLRESLELPNVRQATCPVLWGMGDCSRSNRGQSGVISSWFGIQRTISHSFGDISVILDLGGCSWGLSGVPSSKSRLLTCLIGNTELLCMQCKGIGPGLSPIRKSHGFSRVAEGT